MEMRTLLIYLQTDCGSCAYFLDEEDAIIWYYNSRLCSSPSEINLSYQNIALPI
jgi:hypothetical protein